MGILSSLNFYRDLCMLSQPPWVYICISLVVPGKHCFLEAIHYLWLLKKILPSPLSQIVQTSHLGFSASKSLILNILPSCRSLCWLPSVAKSFSVERGMIHGYSDMSLGVIGSLCSFHRKILVVFPVGPMTSLVLELIYSIRNGTPFHAVALNSIKKWLGGWLVTFITFVPHCIRGITSL